MGDSAEAKGPSAASAVAPAAALLFAILLLLGACGGETTGQGDDGQKNGGKGDGGQGERREPPEETRPVTSGPETTAKDPPKITLGEEPGGQPEVVLRLEGGPTTTFSGLCSVGGEQNVLDGRVPKRFTFDPGGRELSCRIQKRDEGQGALKIILIAGNATRSVQQTNSPGSAINVTYRND